MKSHAIVEYTLLNSQTARDSDTDLILKVWYEQGLHLTHEQKEIIKTKCSKPETIRRIRQKLQEQGKYLASPRVDQARFDKFKDVKGSIGVADAEQVEWLL